MPIHDSRFIIHGARISSIHDFGGDGPIIHLSHANGFPPGTYRRLAETLTARHRVIALPSRPLWPGSQPESAPTWRHLVDDLVQGLADLELRDPGGASGPHNARDVVGVGHSLGGVLTMWAAIRRPDLFCALVLIDPVILPPTWLRMLRIMRLLGLDHRQPLVPGALRRRRIWPSRQACFAHYRGKPLFARWSDAALWDYVESGTHERADGQAELVYPPEWEAHIFGTTPTDVWRDVPQLRTPALIIRGEHSNTFRPVAQARMARKLPHARFVTIPDAGHLAPMERPKVIGAAIQDYLESVGDSGSLG